MSVYHLYLTLLMIGIFGFVAVILMGAVDSAAGSLSHHGHDGLNGSAGHHHGDGHHHSDTMHDALDSLKSGMFAWSFLSPLNFFSICFGMGAAGILARKFIFASPLLGVFALLSGILFNIAFVKPIMRVFLRFESEPSKGLAGAIARPATAVTGFDSSGKGLVQLTLDGHIVQLLASLESAELDGGLRVAKGDELVVVDVDPLRNTCRVTRELSIE